MKRILVIAVAFVMIMGLGAATASAAGNSLKKGSLGFSAGFDNTAETNLSGRYFFTNNVAMTATLGMETHGADMDSDYLAIGAGVRYYLSNDGFAPFVVGRLLLSQYEESDPAGGKIADTSTIDFSVGFGAEYFLHKQFSLEAAVGLGFGTSSDDVANLDDTYFGTDTLGVSATFYF